MKIDIKRVVYQRIEEGLSNDNEICQRIRQDDTLKDTLAQPSLRGRTMCISIPARILSWEMVLIYTAGF